MTDGENAPERITITTGYTDVGDGWWEAPDVNMRGVELENVEYVRIDIIAKQEAEIARHRRWSYCPECGSAKANRPNDTMRICDDCGQDWFTDMDYTDIVRGHLAKARAAEACSESAPSASLALDAAADCVESMRATLTDTASAGSGK